MERPNGQNIFTTIIVGVSTLIISALMTWVGLTSHTTAVEVTALRTDMKHFVQQLDDHNGRIRFLEQIQYNSHPAFESRE